MSFAEKITSLLDNNRRSNQQEPGGGPEVPWYMKYGSRVLGIVAAFFAIIFGLWMVISILVLNVGCLIGGILQILAGFVVMALEAPCCFFCVEYVNVLADKVDARPMYYRAGLYCVMALPPIILCFELASFFGSGLIFATGVVYGMMALGKKASREDMAVAATSPTQMPNNGQMQMGTDQHITLMEDPDVWRPT